MEIIKKFSELYNHATPINDIECQTIDYAIFKKSKYIRFCNSGDLLKYIPTGSDKRLDAFHGFVHENPYFWMIPLMTITQEIFGFVLKSYTQKQYRNIFCQNHICSFYGFHNFNNFKYNTPIILTEGTKDCIMLQSIYPFSLACLTSGLNGLDDLEAIRRLTNKVILAYDNDKSGIKSTERDKLHLIKSGCKVATAFYTTKDVGDLHNNPMGLNILRNSIRCILNSF